MGRGDPMGNEPRLSTWSRESVHALLRDGGFTLSDDICLAAMAHELSVPDRHGKASRVAVVAT